jgi:hypothetical protein
VRAMEETSQRGRVDGSLRTGLKYNVPVMKAAPSRPKKNRSERRRGLFQSSLQKKPVRIPDIDRALSVIKRMGLLSMKT